MSPSIEDVVARLAPLAEPPPAPAAAPLSPAVPPPAPAVAPVRAVEFAQKGYHVDASLPPAAVVDAARALAEAGFALDAVTGVDWLADRQMEVVYDYFHPLGPVRVAVRTRVPRDQAEVPTISGVFPGANWHERETHDFFGIRFLGHPNLKPFLLPEDADFHPLRKDYAP